MAGGTRLVLICPGWAEEKLWGDLAMVLQLARCVLPALLHARSSLVSEQPARCMALNQEGFSCHTVWAARVQCGSTGWDT